MRSADAALTRALSKISQMLYSAFEEAGPMLAKLDTDSAAIGEFAQLIVGVTVDNIIASPQ